MVFDGNSTVLTPSDAVNLLSISANVVTDDELAQLALQAADSGSVLEGVVVVNPDPSDNTTGLVKNDTVRLLPSRAGADASDPELVHLGGRTIDASASPGRHPAPRDVMEATTSNDDPVLGPMIGLRALLATIGRKRRVWLITGLVGLIVGACLHLVIPRKYTRRDRSLPDRTHWRGPRRKSWPTMSLSSRRRWLPSKRSLLAVST